MKGKKGSNYVKLRQTNTSSFINFTTYLTIERRTLVSMPLVSCVKVFIFKEGGCFKILLLKKRKTTNNKARNLHNELLNNSDTAVSDHRH